MKDCIDCAYRNFDINQRYAVFVYSLCYVKIGEYFAAPTGSNIDLPISAIEEWGIYLKVAHTMSKEDEHEFWMKTGELPIHLGFVGQLISKVQSDSSQELAEFLVAHYNFGPLG